MECNEWNEGTKQGVSILINLSIFYAHVMFPNSKKRNLPLFLNLVPFNILWFSRIIFLSNMIFTYYWSHSSHIYTYVLINRIYGYYCHLTSRLKSSVRSPCRLFCPTNQNSPRHVILKPNNNGVWGPNV